MNNEIVKIENGNLIIAEELINKITEFEKRAMEMKLVEEDLKSRIKTAMEENGIDKSFSIGELKISYRKPSKKTTLDSKLIKDELPEIYEKYSKTSDVSSSISISIE